LTTIVDQSGDWQRNGSGRKRLASEETDLLEPILLDELVCHIDSPTSVYHQLQSVPVGWRTGGRNENGISGGSVGANGTAARADSNHNSSRNSDSGDSSCGAGSSGTGH
jgi:hypothetical protein